MAVTALTSMKIRIKLLQTHQGQRLICQDIRDLHFRQTKSTEKKDKSTSGMKVEKSTFKFPRKENGLKQSLTN